MNDSPCTRRGYASLILCIHIRHSIIQPHVKYQKNQANIKKIICIQNSLSHIHLPLFEDEKEQCVDIHAVLELKTFTLFGIG